MASFEGPEEGELETPQDELNENAAEVDVLNDILGDTVGLDEFQEELENTETSAVEVLPPEKPKLSKPAEKATKKKAKKPTSGKKISPSKPSNKASANKDAIEEKKAAPDTKRVDTKISNIQGSGQQHVLSVGAADTSRTKDGKQHLLAAAETKIAASTGTKTEATKKRQDSGKSDAKSSSKTAEEKKPVAAKKVVKKTTANTSKEEKADGRKVEKIAAHGIDTARKESVKTSDKVTEQKSTTANLIGTKEIPAEKKVSKEVKTEKKEVKQKIHGEEDGGASRKRKDTKEKASKQEGEPVDKKAKEKETKDVRAKEKLDAKVAPKKEKPKLEKIVRKDEKRDGNSNKEKSKEEAKAVQDDKGYNLQDNKDDMQIIDDVGASDSSMHHDDDILSRHSGSDFEDMSSNSGSFSRSMSLMSGHSWSRSRSVSGGSSDSFEKVEKAQKEERRKRTKSNEKDEAASGVKSKISRALTADNQRALDECLRNSRYFIIKSNNYENVALSKAKGVWSTPPANERKLNDAYRHYSNVILIFSVKESGRFQGFCRLASESRRDGPVVRWVLPPGFDRKILTGVFKVDWLNRHECLFANCTHLRNPWNENKEIKICRDGQEVEPSVGEQLCRLFPPDEHVDVARLLEYNQPERGSSSRSRSNRRYDESRYREERSSSYQRRHRDSSGHRYKRRQSDDFERDGRSKYYVKKETLLHGSYADYIREFEKSRQLRQFGPAPTAIVHYQVPPRYQRTIDPTTAAAEAFLSREYTTRQQYRSRR